MRSTKHQRRIRAPRAAVYRVLLDPDAIVRWKVPDGMTAEVHQFEAREGGRIRVSLTYEAADQKGKTSAHTDTYHGRFERLVPNESIVEVDEFETDDPAMQGAMTIRITLTDAPVDVDNGIATATELVAVHENLPPGIALADNELGWRMALDKLARLLERPF